MADTPKKYYARFSKGEDFPKLSEFYGLNAHQNVLKREDALIKELAENGSVVLLEDERGDICCASITYGHKVVGAGGVEEVRWSEVGTTRFVLPGYPGLFDILISLQLLRAFMVEPPTNVFVAQMETAPIQNLATNLGWRPMPNVPQEMLDAKHHTLPHDAPPSTPVNWYGFGLESMPRAATLLENALKSGLLTNKKTGEQIEIDLSRIPFFKWFEAEIHELANRDLGNPDKIDYSQNLQKSRDNWMKKFYR